ncbi:MAG: hypothetical protein ACRCWJ_07925 [Casimicrobium sp.]
MLNPNSIFRKTELGAAEVSGRKLGLRAELRRLLILVDGKNTVARLSIFVRPHEAEPLLLELQAVGAIDLADGSAAPATTLGSILAGNTVATQTAAPVVTPAEQGSPSAASTMTTSAFPNMAPTQEQFLAARSAAVRHLNDTLGPSAETFAIKIEKTRSAQELREAVTQVRMSLERMSGAAAGQRFLDAVRSAVKP